MPAVLVHPLRRENALARSELAVLGVDDSEGAAPHQVQVDRLPVGQILVVDPGAGQGQEGGTGRTGSIKYTYRTWTSIVVQPP